MKFVYHGVPERMVGTVLYPLNQLAAIDSRSYEFQRSKYEGREALLQSRIPGFELLWNDTLHCAPLHPYLLFEARRALDLLSSPWMTGRFFEIPVERILVNPVIWASQDVPSTGVARSKSAAPTALDGEFEPFDAARYQALREITAAHLSYLRRMEDSGERPLMFAYIPHVLVAGPIDISGVRTIAWDEPPHTSGRLAAREP